MILPNETAQDERLSWTARGLLVELLSRPQDWETNADALWHRAKDQRGEKVGEGRRGVRSAFGELEKLGYAVRTRSRVERGRFVTILDVYDTPGHNRDTADGTSAKSVSVKAASASVASLQSTDLQRTDLQSTEDKHSATLADARVGALASAENLDAKTQAALAWGLADEAQDAEAQRGEDRAAAREARRAQLHELYDAVDRLSDRDLRNALLKFERQRKRIYRDSRNDAIEQIKEEDPALLNVDTAARRIDNLSYKYGLKHYYDEDREWPAFLVRPLLGGGRRGRVA